MTEDIHRYLGSVLRPLLKNALIKGKGQDSRNLMAASAAFPSLNS
jgi:hypothetical protein